jgi:hypothetical protein
MGWPQQRRALRDKVQETPTAFVISVEAPHNRFKIDRERDTLRIRDVQHGAYDRRFQLPDNVNAAGISADRDRGILTVKIPKTQKLSEQQEVPISTTHRPSAKSSLEFKQPTPEQLSRWREERRNARTKASSGELRQSFHPNLIRSHSEEAMVDGFLDHDDGLEVTEEVPDEWADEVHEYSLEHTDSDGYSGFMQRGKFIRY